MRFIFFKGVEFQKLAINVKYTHATCVEQHKLTKKNLNKTNVWIFLENEHSIPGQHKKNAQSCLVGTREPGDLTDRSNNL